VAAKRVATKPPVPFELTSAQETEFDEREPLFSLNGTIHTVLVGVPASVALEYAFTAVEAGDGAAVVFALNYALGAESRRALMTHKGLTAEQLGKIITVIRGKFDGALVAPKATPASA
jgi:hypothetical protein